jgi:hypothetical protein
MYYVPKYLNPAIFLNNQTHTAYAYLSHYFTWYFDCVVKSKYLSLHYF